MQTQKSWIDVNFRFCRVGHSAANDAFALTTADVTFYLSADRSSFSAKGQNSFASTTVSLDKPQNQILQIRKATNGGS